MDGHGDTEMEAEKQIQVRFTTKLPPALRVVSSAFAVPAKLTRYGLSDVVNTLLGLEKPQPFDFLVDGELVRTSLEQLLLIKSISAETTLSIEYIPAVVPPEPQEARAHDEWVTAVSGSNPKFMITGSYDSFGRIWNTEGECTHLLEGHKDVITSLAYIPAPGTSAKQLQLVTASKDHSLQLWQVSLEEEFSTISHIKPAKRFKGHTASVQSVSASPSGTEVCSGSWDASIKLWNLTGETLAEEDGGKKRKLSGSAAVELSEQQIQAQATLQGHTQVVGAVDWAERETIYSVSWDHSLRMWDVETGINTLTLSLLPPAPRVKDEQGNCLVHFQACSKALHCVSAGAEGTSLLAAGGADNVLRIWDPRLPGTVSPTLQLSSHKGWISACKWHPKSSYHILSASYDSTLKLWDTRSSVPLHTLTGHKDKVLSADWWKDDCIISGGADSVLQVFSKLKLFY